MTVARPIEPPSDQELRDLLRSSRVIAVVGASSNPARPSHAIFALLRRLGYQAIPVNPNESQVLGVAAVPSLEQVPEPIDIVNVFRRPEELSAIATSGARVGARCLWLQSGLRSPAAAAIAEQAGQTVVMDTCIAVSIALLGVRGPEGVSSH